MKIIERASEYIGVIKNILNCETTDYLEIGFSDCKCSLAILIFESYYTIKTKGVICSFIHPFS